jgi:uncharacterized protein with PQ loop repeat
VTLQVLGVIAVMVQAVRSIPQALHIVAHKRTDGVSVLAWSLAFACHSSWVVFGATQEVMPVLVANGTTVVGVVAILLTLGRYGRGVARTFLKVAGVVMVLDLLAFALIGPVGIGVIAASTAIVMFVPQVFVVMRAENKQGVSVASWVLILVSSCLWGAYGIASRNWVVAMGTAVIVPSAVVILVQVLRSGAPIDHQPVNDDMPIAS